MFLLSTVLLLSCGAASSSLDHSGEFYKWIGKTFSIPLEIKDNSVAGRSSWPVTSGVPFPAGLVFEPNNLRLTDADGREIPCQFTVLSRYWARDKSIRWLLLDFQINLAAHGTATNKKGSGKLGTGQTRAVAEAARRHNLTEFLH